MELTRTNEFQRNYSKLIRKGYARSVLEDEVQTVAYYLMSGIRIPDSYDDHQLEDNLSNFRELHLEGDLLLMYRKTPNRVTLVNIGTHDMLFRTVLMKKKKRKKGRGFFGFFD